MEKEELRLALASLSLCSLCRWKMHTDWDLFAPRCPLYRRTKTSRKHPHHYWPSAGWAALIFTAWTAVIASVNPEGLQQPPLLRAIQWFWHWNLSEWHFAHLFWGISVCAAQATERAGLRKHLPLWRAAHFSDPAHIRWFPCLRYLAAAPFGPATIGCPGPLLFPTHSLIIRELTMSQSPSLDLRGIYLQTSGILLKVQRFKTRPLTSVPTI